MMQITFTGSAEEVRAEMLVLLGIDRCEQPATPEPAPVEATDEEPKRGRGRPRKTKDEEVVVTEPAPQPEVEPEVQFSDSHVTSGESELRTETVITYTEQDQAAAKAALEVLKEVVAPEPEPIPEPVGTPCPGNAQDLMSAAMEIVKGDSGKKIELVKLLQSYGAKTINTLAPEHYAEFWVKVQGL